MLAWYIGTNNLHENVTIRCHQTWFLMPKLRKNSTSVGASPQTAHSTPETAFKRKEGGREWEWREREWREREARGRRGGKERKRKGEWRDEERATPLYNAVESIVFRYFFSHKIVTRGPLKSWKCIRKRLAAGLRPDPLGEFKRSPDPLAAIWAYF